MLEIKRLKKKRENTSLLGSGFSLMFFVFFWDSSYFAWFLSCLLVFLVSFLVAVNLTSCFTLIVCLVLLTSFGPFSSDCFHLCLMCVNIGCFSLPSKQRPDLCTSKCVLVHMYQRIVLAKYELPKTGGSSSVFLQLDSSVLDSTTATTNIFSTTSMI